MKLVIDTKEEFEAWLSEQDEFLVKDGVEEPESEQATNPDESTNVTASL